MADLREVSCSTDGEPGANETQSAAHLLSTAKGPQDFEARATELLKLEAGWNSYGAPPIDESAINHARPLFALLERLGLSPWLTPSTSGGVSIENAGAVEYAIEVEPSGLTSVWFDGLSNESAATVIATAARQFPLPSPTRSKG